MAGQNEVGGTAVRRNSVLRGVVFFNFRHLFLAKMGIQGCSQTHGTVQHSLASVEGNRPLIRAQPPGRPMDALLLVCLSF